VATSVFSPDNGRIFYACQAVLFKKRQSTTSGGADAPEDGDLLSGVQSVGVSSSFQRTPYSDFGRFQKEYGSYGKQIFTITIDRVIDGATSALGRGTPFYYPAGNPSSYKNSHILKSTNIGSDGFSGSLRNYDITLLYGGDSFADMGDDDDGLPPNPGTVVSQTTYRCCLLTEISYSISVQGAVTESITLVTGVATHNDNTTRSNYDALSAYPESAGAVMQGKHVDTNLCVFPLEVQRMFDMGQVKKEGNPPVNVPVLGLQSIEISASIDYSDMFDYGEFGGTRGDLDEERYPRQNEMKQVTLPVAVTASFTGVVRDQYYGNQAWQWRIEDQTLDNTTSILDPLKIYKWEREIAIYSSAQNSGGTELYMHWLLGKKNYLTDISYSGGDAGGGGNVEATLSYQNEHSDFITYKSGTLYPNPTSGTIY
jgi:hypothetical protein